MTDIPFVPPLEVRYGAVEQVSPRIRRVVAENPSRFTYRGTGTYVVGQAGWPSSTPGPSSTPIATRWPPRWPASRSRTSS